MVLPLFRGNLHPNYVRRRNRNIGIGTALLSTAVAAAISAVGLYNHFTADKGLDDFQIGGIDGFNYVEVPINEDGSERMPAINPIGTDDLLSFSDGHLREMYYLAYPIYATGNAERGKREGLREDIPSIISVPYKK